MTESLKLQPLSPQAQVLALERWAGIIEKHLIFPAAFGITGIAQSLGDSRLYRMLPGAVPVAVQRGITVPWKCGVVAMSLKGSDVVGAGSASFGVFEEGVEVSPSERLVWDASSKTSEVYNPEAMVVEANSEVDVRVTTTADFTLGLDAEVVLFLSHFP